MSAQWAVRFHITSILAALPLRLHRGIEFCQQTDELFLRGDIEWNDVEKQILQIPDAVIYRILSDRRLVRIGRLIPEISLPDGPWAPLASLFELRPIPAAMPGSITRRIPVRLARDDSEQTPGAVLTTAQQWAAYVSDAPQVRLHHLQFAAAHDGSVLVIGTPLPPVRGEYLVERDGLLIPCGFAWEPRVQSSILRKLMGLTSGDLARFLPDGSYELISADALVRASRSAARLTLHRLESVSQQQ